MSKIQSISELEAVYGEPMHGTDWKEIDHINDHYRQFIEKSPFLILATQGDKGIDCSPRGDPAGFIRIVNERCIQMPDRRGNNRLDSLRNIIANPEVGLIFLIPNIGETIRLSGKAEILVDKDLCDSFALKGKPASSVLSINVDKVYFQCPKALVRSKLWSSSSHQDRKNLPSNGTMIKVFAEKNKAEFDAQKYDDDYPDRLNKTIY
jgi:PPOX class probable FMN-dependent enzyme